MIDCGVQQLTGNFGKGQFQVQLQKTVEKYGLPDYIIEMLESGDLVQLKLADGSTEYNVNVQNDKPWRSKEKMHTARFILPDGYSRYAFSLETQGNQGDIAHAYWASENPDDASVVLHVKTSRSLKAYSDLNASVCNVFGKRKK